MYNIALEFARRGGDVTVYAGEWNAPEYPEGVKVELLKLSGMSNHARALDFARKFHIASAGADVRFAFNRFGGCDFYFAADDCVKAALKRRAGAFLLRHFGRYRTFLKLEEAIFSPDSRTVIFYISPKQLDEFQAEYGTPADRFVYLGPGVGRDYFLPDAELRQKHRQAAMRDQTVFRSFQVWCADVLPFPMGQHCHQRRTSQSPVINIQRRLFCTRSKVLFFHLFQRTFCRYQTQRQWLFLLFQMEQNPHTRYTC